MSDGWICLLYHDVLAGAPPANGGSQRFAVSLSAFEEQLNIIEASGARGCSIGEALESRGPDCIAISFDDGDRGQYERAFPALRAKGMTATFFITTAWVGTDGYATWDQLREMKEAGMSIQSHTHTHPILAELDADQLAAELWRSKAELDSALDQDTDEIALPGGDLPAPSLRGLMYDAGYRVVATSRWGANDRVRVDGGMPLKINRCTVQGEPAGAHFRRIIAGDAWLAARRRARDAALRGLRSALGPSRYSVLRRRVLDVASRL